MTVMFRLCIVLALLGLTAAFAAEQRAFTIQEPFGLAWGPDRVSYPVSFPQGAFFENRVSLKSEAGGLQAVQFAGVTTWPDGSIRTATLYFMATLQPNEKRTWTLTAEAAPLSEPIKAALSDLKVSLDQQAHVIQMENSKTGIRLAGGFLGGFGQAYTMDQIPAPIQAVKLSDGRWIGKGAWQTDVPFVSMKALVTDRGPVFARAKLHYSFADGKAYDATVELNAGQELAVVSESFNLAEGKRYPMTGQSGMQPGDTFAYVPPKFTSPDRALIWDWWSPTYAKLPTPNQYLFSFEELKADRAEFTGYNSYGNIKVKGDPRSQTIGEVACDKDGRFLYINGFQQWGDEESTYVGLFNAQNPTTMLAVTGLRPKQWLHPDIDPHPDSTIKQYVQTNCITLERRTNGAMFFRAPACLGKRVYGIGGMARTVAPHLVPNRGAGPSWSAPELGDDLLLAHVRLGRMELNTVKDWVLDYPETSKYPRLFVPEGDRVRYESRRLRKPIDEVQKLLDAQQGKEPTAADKKIVTDAIARARGLVQFCAQTQKGLMDYGIEEGPITELAEAALANPACTPEQAKELRKWLAAIAYYALDENFVPGRDKGWGWGSANQFAQVQCRTCYIVSLLPNHPQGKAWRQALGKVVTLYLTDQINEHGVTLECPHYGGMAIEMPLLALTTLSNCGDVDLSEATKRLRAAAYMRMATMLPWDVRGNMRAESPKGDGYYMTEYTLPAQIGFLQKTDPALVRNLAWACREGGMDLNAPRLIDKELVDVGLPVEEPKLGSEYFPGFGLVMRNGFPRHDESYLQISADGWDWGHGHNDRGSWIMYAKGAPLMLDFAAMYTPSMRELWLHPGGLTFNHDETVRPAGTDPKDDWWHASANPDYRNLTTAPFTVIEPFISPTPKDELDRWGQVTAFKSGPRADYAEMQRRIGYLRRVPYLLQPVHGKDLFDDSAHQPINLKTPFVWTRRFVFVKDADPLGHNYLVIRDDLTGNGELDPYLNLWCLATTVDIKGQTAVYTGQHGVDLHCYVAEPATFTPKTRTVGHPCGFEFANYYRKTFGKPFREDQIQLQIPQTTKGGGYFVVMVPVKQDEAVPKFETLAGGKAVRVTFADRVDTIVLQPAGSTVTIDGKKIATPSAVIIKRQTKQEVINLSGK